MATTMAQKAQHPQRITERLFSYWEGQKRGRAFPSETDINPDELGDVWDYCFLVNVRDGGKTLKYSYMGHSLLEAYGSDVTNEEVRTHLVSPERPPMFEKFKQVIKEKTAVMDEGEFVNLHQHRIRYRSCLLPLSGSDGGVTYILGGMKWKSY